MNNNSIHKRFITKSEVLFLFLVYLSGLYFRLIPRLMIDSHLLTLNADIWERLAISQYFADYGKLPQYCLRYIAYGKVPFWYPPLGPVTFALLSKISHLDIPTVSSRIIPFFEALTPLSFYFLVRYLTNRPIAYLSAGILCFTPSFVYWSGISDPQSFTLFMLPVYLLIWISYLRKKDSLSIKSRLLRLSFLGFLLGISFLIHLTYFLVFFIMLLVSLALVIKEKYKLSIYVDLPFAFIISQVITMWWWLPHNLYWWWIKALVTSSGLTSHFQQLNEYGFTTGLLGVSATIFLIIYNIFWPKKQKSDNLILFALFWMLIPLLETQNEVILKAINRLDLTWSTLFKPLEGFRFYCFLAQPLSFISGLFLFKIMPNTGERIFAKSLKFLCIFLLFSGFIFDIHFNYKFYAQIQNSGITKQEYNAAVWFRNHSQPDGRIIADYYCVQMFAGVCGGKALLGGLFALRNVNLPYIKVPAEVQDDIYIIYSTKDIPKTLELMRKYKCTHIFFSDNMIKSGALGSKYKSGFGVDINKEKFKDKRYFEEVYKNGNAVIIKIKNNKNT